LGTAIDTGAGLSAGFARGVSGDFVEGILGGAGSDENVEPADPIAIKRPSRTRREIERPISDLPRKSVQAISTISIPTV
jgi:hypothetical protein